MFSLLLFIYFTIIISCLFYIRFSFKRYVPKVKMEGKVVIVTGANAGIGFHTAKKLAQSGARVILACRNEGRGVGARDDIIKQTGNYNVIFRQLDLASLKSVRKFAAHIIETEDQLHILINNAGVYGFTDYTEDGIIETMQVNYFGHFLLTLLLLPLLKKSQPSRIINLSSVLHFLGDFNLKTVNKKCKGFKIYCNSKLCMLLFSRELALKLKDSGVVANAVHPGVILTNIVANGPKISQFLFWCWCWMYCRTAEQGAETVIYLAIAEECANVSGKYFVDCRRWFTCWRAWNDAAAKELWDYSEKLVGYTA